MLELEVTLTAAPEPRRKMLRSGLRPRQDSNLRTRLRRPVLYPLSYEGRELWDGRSV